jgi:hypothetical protein
MEQTKTRATAWPTNETEASGGCHVDGRRPDKIGVTHFGFFFIPARNSVAEARDIEIEGSVFHLLDTKERVCLTQKKEAT